MPTVPSAAAIQRALSAAGTPQLQSPASPDFSVDGPRPHRAGKQLGGGGVPFGLSSARVKSPPPSAISTRASLYSPRKPDQSSQTPSIVLERPHSVTTPGTDLGIEGEDNSRSGTKTPVRGSSGAGSTLETVQESSLPATPAIAVGKIQSASKVGADDRPERIEENQLEEASGKGMKKNPESGSESGGNKSAGTKNQENVRKKSVVGNSSAHPQVHPKKSVTQLNSGKGKTGNDGTVRNMTVETETVSSVPQVAVGGGASERILPGLGRTDTGSTLRLKPSTETIRPRKEKKRTVRKAPSVNSGTGGSLFRRFHHHHIYSRPPSPDNTSSQSPTSPNSISGCPPDSLYFTPIFQPSLRKDMHTRSASVGFDNSRPTPQTMHSSAGLTTFRSRTASSKADIFEAKVASAVDEANSSDSEETFVYESNPPEPLSARPHRYHSRTPSATSMASQADHYGGRVRQDGHHSIAGKKSMKFANNSHHTNGFYGDSGDPGTVRGPNSAGRTSGGNIPHHHRLGHYGAGHTSLFDKNSPFPNANKSPRTVVSHFTRLSPRPSSPRSPHIIRIPGSSKNAEESLTYDLEGEGADDERTPLVGSIRYSRNRNSRRILSSSQHGSYVGRRKQDFCRRITAFVALGSLVALLITALIVILIMCSKPLIHVHIADIENVIASEQEIMLDLHVHAINPNLIAVQVSDLDINIFAKSKYVGTSCIWRDDHAPNRNEGRDRKSPFMDASYGQQLDDKKFRNNHYVTDGIDEGTDPIEDPEADSQTMLLGRIFEFDSPLIFDPSPIRRHSLSSTGEVRLAKPGNRTEEGGSERWEKVIQHPFELIVRGVVRYSLAISTRTRSASIGGSVVVHPEAGVDKSGSTWVSKAFGARSNAIVWGSEGKRPLKIRLIA